MASPSVDDACRTTMPPPVDWTPTYVLPTRNTLGSAARRLVCPCGAASRADGAPWAVPGGERKSVAARAAASASWRSRRCSRCTGCRTSGCGRR
ncbi:hypothetical protein H0E86_15000 [Streptomyces sp. SCSIO-PteL053]|nr:hypothetical protein H0E86_15000 [Streptomyces sp. SCSIO-PteL053]